MCYILFIYFFFVYIHPIKNIIEQSRQSELHLCLIRFEFDLLRLTHASDN